MAWFRVRTGVARTPAGWRVVQRIDDGPLQLVGDPYPTEHEAEKAAVLVAKTLREKFLTRDNEGDSDGT